MATRPWNLERGLRGRCCFVALTWLLGVLAGCRGYERPRVDADDPWLLGQEHALDTGATTVFAAVGDAGKPNLAQARVARSVRAACEGRCDFVVLLGDNAYESGVVDASDEARLGCTVESYGAPVAYLALGNHDYDPIEPTIERARNELRWIRGPGQQLSGTRAAGDHHFYRFDAGPVHLVALDTNLLVRGQLDERSYLALAKWLGPLRSPAHPWTVAFGHHPFRSNGSHRSAGGFHDASLSLWPGRLFEHFMTRHVVGRADLYLAGHDHNLQMIPGLLSGLTTQVVSGSGAKCDSPPQERPQPALMERFGHGFVIVEASPERLVLTFHDAWGEAFFVARRRVGEAGWQAEPSRDGREHCAAELERIHAEPLPTCANAQRHGNVAEP
jgi:tartrate-resistant acid phosphatase type 5